MCARWEQYIYECLDLWRKSSVLGIIDKPTLMVEEPTKSFPEESVSSVEPDLVSIPLTNEQIAKELREHPPKQLEGITDPTIVGILKQLQDALQDGGQATP